MNSMSFVPGLADATGLWAVATVVVASIAGAAFMSFIHTPRIIAHYSVLYFENVTFPLHESARARIGAFCACMALVGACLAFASMHAPSRGFGALGLVLLAPVLVSISWIDFRLKLIPDRYQLVGCILAITERALEGAWGGVAWQEIGMDCALGMSLSFLLWALTFLYCKARKLDGLGFGDIKMLLWMGVLLGGGVFPMLVLATLLALCVNLVRLLFTRFRWKDEFAFGPYLVVAFLVLRLFPVL